MQISYRAYNSYHWGSISLSQHNQTEQRKIHNAITKYKAIKQSLAHVDWKDKTKNKRATECWTILRIELDSAIVPMKKQGKRYKKKHLSKEAFRKIRYKQAMWLVYKHTGKDADYDVCKQALNEATHEVRKSKRNVDH